ncbi:mitochondrial carrier [Auriculariales sp. MPI-PUGE-AT-0066]|nr:mitochondrial carrier [Auriculariales sp. MPI-PUGE-AT-0066]
MPAPGICPFRREILRFCVPAYAFRASQPLSLLASLEMTSNIVLAGAFAAFTVDMLIYPLDTIKTRIQSRQYVQNAGSLATSRAALFRGLYAGIGSIVAASLPSSALFFLTYETTKARLEKDAVLSLPSPLIHMLASTCAEAVACAIDTPAEVVKQNAQMLVVAPNPSLATSAAPATTVSPTLQTFARFRANPAALWTGFTVLAARNMPFSAIQFPLYEYCKKSLRTSHPTLSDSANAAVAGIISGTPAALLTTPMDVIKTRVMLAASTTQRPSVVQTAKFLVQTEGFGALWKGAGLRVGWIGLGSGLYLGSYEWMKGRLFKSETVQDA